MSIFGNIQNGVFSGFGKPYIKLEFDDNTALLDFQKRMNESGEAQESEFEDGEFKPIEGIKDYLKADLKKYAEPFINKRLNKTNILEDFGEGEPFEFKQDIKIYKVNTPVGVVYLTTNQWDKLTTKGREKYFGLIKPTLTRPLYILKEENNRLCFAKTFSDGNKIVLFYSVVGDFGNIKNGSITNFEKRKLNDIITKIESGDVRYISPTLKTRLQTTASTSNTPLVAVGTLLNGLTFENAKGLIFDEKNLGAAGDFYTVLDVRTRARKEPGELTANKNLKFQKTDSIKNFDVKLFNKDFDKKTDIYEYSTKTINNVKYIELDAKKKHDEKLYTNITVWQPISFNKKENSFICTYNNYDIEIDSKKAKNIKKIGDRYSLFITETYYNQLCNEAVNKDIADLKRYANEENERILKNYSILYKNPRAYNIYMRMFEKSEPRKMIEKNIKDIERVSINGLGKPGDVYLVTDTRKNPRKELDETAAFKKIDIEKFNVNALKALQDSDPILYEEIKAGIGKTANPYLYNNNEIIDCRGLKPTYRILDNYDNFFDVADTKTSFAGFGLTDTKKLISETCRAHWKDCKKIAAHLKGDSLLQSCFNLWHWLRFNIRYEYDKEGREEIRTPLRVWHDRARGVDCDCLSVFSWCVLRCMGYDPVFELVAFKNRPQFSHIFINCDGVVVDRVWFVFNSRPPLVTKRELFRVDLINNLGQLF